MNEYKVADITGQKFGRLTVIKRDTNKHKHKGAYWVCRCDCGKEHIVNGTYLRMGIVQSCGCLRVEHGKEMGKDLNHKRGRKPIGVVLSKEEPRLYHVWAGMRSRCYNKKFPQYKDYGGRGITVCNEWNSFENFMNWAYANGYDKNAKRGQCTIDRIDNDKGYSPDNCRWITQSEQARNRRPRCKKPA